MTATLTAVPPSSAPASNGTAPAAGGAVAQRVPLEQFDSVFGSLIGTSPNSHSRLVERVLTSRRYHSLGLTSRRIFRYRQPHPALCVSAIHHTVHATSRYAAPELKELSSDALGGHVVDVSDEFFCSASNLLKVPPSVSMKGQFGPNGALFDGWESRRHNPTYDWSWPCRTIIKLGALGSISGFDIDSGHFSGNECALSFPLQDIGWMSVTAWRSPHLDPPQWQPLLPITPLGPAQRHLFLLPSASQPVTHLKLTMHPDGGLGRFRAYGRVIPPPAPAHPTGEAVDLAYVLNGGTVTGESDQHFGRGGNLILPGRGKDMGDGWETRRSRGRLGTGKGDWVVVKLAEPGYLEWVDIDTLHFVGNFPNAAELYGINSSEECPKSDDPNWTRILEMTKLGPHRQHFYQLSQPEKAWTHVRLDIHPDGGVKRLRLYGRPASQYPDFSALVPLPAPTPAGQVNGTSSSSVAKVNGASSHARSVPKIPAVPLNPSAFAPYGSVIQSYPDERAAPKEIKIKTVNFGTARKFNQLAPVEYVPPPAGRFTTADGSPIPAGEINFCVFRCEPQNSKQLSAADGTGKRQWNVEVLERHEFSSQAFVPMGGTPVQDGEGQYLVLVALPGNGQPDLSTLRAFTATHLQGISYRPNVWHAPLISLGADKHDFACVVHETGVPEVDCEIKWFEEGVVAVVEEI
ncbi:Allantoicase [Rhodotorula sp. JG-1b]|nr:Allantoicase [Rhodotorula sp. JG-1b]